MNSLEYLQRMDKNYPNFKMSEVQLFDDSKTGNKALTKDPIPVKNYSLDVLDKGLSHYNKLGSGVFFSVNQTDCSGKRKTENIIGVNAWICECDDKTKDEQIENINKCPLKPSLVIESKKSFHMYWFSEGGTKENRKKICRGLCNYFNGDSKIIDITRVLRIPGYNHMKDRDNPFLCTIKEYNGNYYTEEEMLNAYPDTMSVAEKEANNFMKYNKILEESRVKNGNDTRYNINKQDSKTMLEEISGHQMVGYDSFSFKSISGGGYRILSNGKETSCWIDKNGLIGSNDNGGPTWVNRVLRYGKYDVKDIYQYIKDRHPELIDITKPQNKENNNYETEIDDDPLFEDYEYKGIDFATKVPFTRGLESVDKKFGKIDYGKFVTCVGESGGGKSTYTFFQAIANANNGYKVLYISLEQKPEELFLLKALKRYGVTKEQRDEKSLEDYQKQKIDEMMKELSTHPNLRVARTPNPTINRVKKAIQQASTEGYKLVYVDNLGMLMGGNRLSESKEFEIVSLASRELMELSHSIGTTIILIHHFTKGDRMSRLMPRELSDIRGGAKIEHDSDLVFQVRRDLSATDDIEKKLETTLLLQKNRAWGDTPSIEIKFDKGAYVDNISEGKKAPY